MQIEKLLAQAKCPIVVGGTNYYIESLLWDILISPPATAMSDDEASTSANTQQMSTATGSEAGMPHNVNIAGKKQNYAF